MSEEDDSGVLRLVDEAVAGGAVPGAVAIAGRSGRANERWVAGWADTTAGARRAMTADTRFDLASLTKVVATMPLVLGLVAAGRVDLDDPVGRYLPAVGGDRAGGDRAGGDRAGGVTVERLLTHTSGLPATAELWLNCSSAAEARLAVREIAPVAEPGTAVVYSDVGYLLLGQLVEAVLDEPLAAAFSRRIAGPLGMEDTGFGPIAGPDGVAATEAGPDGRPWVGVVHDENARFLGGVAGHAGLFAPAADLARFAAWWVGDDDGPVPSGLRRRATALRTGGQGGRRGLGWVRRGDAFDILEGWPAGAVSHTGFTGTSLALDPQSRAWVVLLTNAVHDGRHKEPIRALRRAVHAALAPAEPPPAEPPPAEPPPAEPEVGGGVRSAPGPVPGTN